MNRWILRELTETNGDKVYQVSNPSVPNFVFETKEKAIAVQYLNMLNGSFPKQDEPKIELQPDRKYPFPEIPTKPYDKPLSNPVVGQCSKCGRDMYKADMYCCQNNECPSRIRF